MRSKRSIVAARTAAFIIDFAVEGLIAVLTALSGALFATLYSEVEAGDADYVQSTVRFGAKVGLFVGILYAGILNRVFYMKLTEATVGLHLMGLRIWNPSKEHTFWPLFFRMCFRHVLLHGVAYPMEVSWRDSSPSLVETKIEPILAPHQGEQKAA
jgi:hypothetical protein